MTTRPVRGARRVMKGLDKKTRKNVCKALPRVRANVNSLGMKAFRRDDGASAALLANESAFLKRWQGECNGVRGGKLSSKRARYTEDEDVE